MRIAIALALAHSALTAPAIPTNTTWALLAWGWDGGGKDNVTAKTTVVDIVRAAHYAAFGSLGVSTRDLQHLVKVFLTIPLVAVSLY